MLRKNTKKPGFTLMELMMVVGIIAIITMLTIQNFGSLQQRNLLSLAGDDLVNLFQETYKNARLGKNMEKEAICWGIEISRTKPYIEQFTAKFNKNNKQCEQDKTITKTNIFDNPNLKINEINNSNQSELRIEFSPPKGTVLNPKKQSTFQVQYGENPDLVRTFEFNPNTALLKEIKPQTQSAS